MVIEQDWLIRVFKPKNVINLITVFQNREEGCFRHLEANFTLTKDDGSPNDTVYCYLKYHINFNSLGTEDPKPREYFASERYWYDVIYPRFVNFQETKGVGSPFNHAPKCHGTLEEEGSAVLTQRVIVLEDVNYTGHELWPSSHPLSWKQLEAVMVAYAKLHATSVAMQKHQPRKFKEITDFVTKLEKNRKEALGVDDECVQYEPGLERLFQYLDIDMDVKSPEKKTEEEKDGFVVLDAPKDQPEFFMKAIVHGDCWTNNFLSRFADLNGETVPRDLVIVDWQMIQFRSPIYDISSFIFTYISEEDIEGLETLLMYYYEHFCAHLRRLGIPETQTLYSDQQFKDEWKMFFMDGLVASFHALVKKNKGGSESSVVFMDTVRLSRRFKRIVDFLRDCDLIER